MCLESPGLGCAAKEAYTDFDKKVTHLCELKQFFMEEVQKIPDTVLNSLPGDQGAPHIVSVSFAGVRSEVLLHALEERGFRYLPGFSMFFQQKTSGQSGIKRNWSEKRFAGFYRAIQFL